MSIIAHFTITVDCLFFETKFMILHYRVYRYENCAPVASCCWCDS